jgi:hypothetical protein
MHTARARFRRAAGPASASGKVRPLAQPANVGVSHVRTLCGTGLLRDGEVGISATNRNFKGRMGSASAFAYLGKLCASHVGGLCRAEPVCASHRAASPTVVAASAIAGKIVSPSTALGVPAQPVRFSRTVHSTQGAAAKVRLLEFVIDAC